MPRIWLSLEGKQAMLIFIILWAISSDLFFSFTLVTCLYKSQAAEIDDPQNHIRSQLCYKGWRQVVYDVIYKFFFLNISSIF